MNATLTPVGKPPLRTAFGMELPPVEILDVGAMAEGEDRYAGLVAQGLANVIGFEPNMTELARLQQREGEAGGRKKYLPLCLGRGGPARFFVTRYAGCSSLYEPDADVIDLFMTMEASSGGGNFRAVRAVPVETTRLDDVPQLPPCDFLKIDVQGAELDVLEGGKRVLAQVGVLEVEVEFIPLYKGQPLFCDVQNLLRSQGFLLHKLIDAGGRGLRPLQFSGNATAPVSQLMWADAVFVRDYTKLGGWSDDQLLKAAMVSYDVYCSHDLVHRLLTEWDRRRGDAVAARFVQTLQAMPRIPLQFLTIKAHA